MATIIKNKKGFQVIQIGYFEMVGLTNNPDPVCDNCLDAKVNQGYYIAVLNQWFCKKCYEQWYKTAIPNGQDLVIEMQNFNNYITALSNMGIILKEKQQKEKYYEENN